MCRWAPAWSNKRIYIQSDNITSVATINRGTSKDPFVMSCLRILFWLSAKYNFHITSRYIPGLINTIADNISRAHEPGRFGQFLPYVIPSDLSLHMSQASLSFLFGRFFGQRENDDYIGSRSFNFESAHFCWIHSAYLPVPPISLPSVLCRLKYCTCPYFLFKSRTLHCIFRAKFSYSSVRQYLNVVRIMHLDEGHCNPLANNWYLKGQI